MTHHVEHRGLAERRELLEQEAPERLRPYGRNVAVVQRRKPRIATETVGRRGGRRRRGAGRRCGSGGGWQHGGAIISSEHSLCHDDWSVKSHRVRAAAITFRCVACLLGLTSSVYATPGAPVKPPPPGAHAVPAKGPGLGFGGARALRPVPGAGAARPGAVAAAGTPTGKLGPLFPLVKARGKRPVAAGPL